MKKSLLIFIFTFVIQKSFAAEAGMPQLDPEFWFSQAFWLIVVFLVIYLTISKIFIPKIKDNLDERENTIKKNLEDAKNFQNLSEQKQKEYEKVLSETKKEVNKIISDSKKALDKDIKEKKLAIDKEIDAEINILYSKPSGEKEIVELKSNSLSSINKIASDIASEIINKITGSKLNESSINAVVNENSKKHLKNLL